MDTPASVPFVPADFDVPRSLTVGPARLVVLGPEHNASDHAAWSRSMEHIHGTPGFENRPWPHPMPLEQNLQDLLRHAADFEARTSFTYTVLLDDDVIGCVYIDPTPVPGDASVRSWVSADHAHLDEPLYRAVHHWLTTAWPFHHVHYAARTPSP
jgi:hypothetical protein